MLRLRFHLKALMWLTIAAAIINLPLAVLCMIPDTQRMPKGSNRQVSGAAAALLPHPVRQPADQPPWPPPQIYSVERAFANVRRHSWSQVNDNLQFSAEYEGFGFPLTALYEDHAWWPFDDPAWKSSAPPSPGLKVAWQGVLFNPPILAIASWLIFFAPVLIFQIMRARHRARKNCCTNCGYPLIPNNPCPECGHTAYHTRTTS